MQIVRKNRIPGRENPSRTFEGLYDFSQLFTMFLIVTVAVFVLYTVGLLAVNFISPRTVQNMDRNMTVQAFNALHENRNFESAIALMEINKSYVDEISNLDRVKLGECYEEVGEISKAIGFYSKCWDSFCYSENKLQSETLDVIGNPLQRMIEAYIKTGDLMRASECLIEADSLGLLSNDIALYRAIVNYSQQPVESINQLRHFLEDMEKKSSTPPNTKLKLLNLLIKWEIENGLAQSAKSDIELAELIARKSKKVAEYESFGELAGFCRWAGKNNSYNRLMRLFTKYLKRSRGMKKPEAVHYVKFLVFKGRYFDAERRLSAICSDLQSRIISNILLMSDEQREFYIHTIDEPFSYAEELLVEHPSPTLAKLVASNMLFKKGLLLRSNRNQRIAIEEMNEPKLNAIYEELISAKKELAVIRAIGRSEQMVRVLSLKKQIYSLDKKLSEACAKYVSEELLQSSFSLDALQSFLSRKESFTYFAQNRLDKLFALHITKKGDVKYFGLGDKDCIDEEVYRSPELLYGDMSVYERFVSSIALPDKKQGNAYYTTSGIFNQISFGALRLPDGMNLMDKVNLRLISDPTSIVRVKHSDRKYETISLWGGIRYSDFSEEPRNITHRGIKRGEHLVYLRGSLYEVQRISEIMDGISCSCNVFTSNDATEASFKARDGKGDDVIHISTHGFFNENELLTNEYNMMDNSGLFFAGADRYWASDTASVAVTNDGNDGILRSSEIELMNLNECYLVVLSACETGLGYDDNSEGVYGLQRAFKLAGAEKIMMSLWEVPDTETSLLMECFYKNLKDGEEPNDALWKAQDSVRRQYPSPESWGGFVLLN